MKRLSDLLTDECKAELINVFLELNECIHILRNYLNDPIYYENGETVEKRLKDMTDWTNKFSEQAEKLKAIKIVLKEKK